MSYELSIDRVMGLEYLSTSFGAKGVTVFSGVNAVGKSTVAACLRALLARDPDPLQLGRSRSRFYGASEGEPPEASLTYHGVDGPSVVTWKPASAGIVSDADDDRALTRRSLAGGEDYTSRRSARERFRLLYESLEHDPVGLAQGMQRALRGDLIDAVGESEAGRIIDSLSTDGWDAAEESFASRARKSKADWADVAGEAYGVKKAVDWLPKGWLASWDGLSVDDADVAASASRDAAAQALVSRVELACPRCGASPLHLVDGALVDGAPASVDGAQERQREAADVCRRLVRQKRDADAFAASAASYAAVAKKLGMDGVRGAFVDTQRARLNVRMRDMSDRLSWPGQPRFIDDCSLTVFGRPAELASESERWLANLLAHLAMLDSSGWRATVIDRADVLDTEMWERLWDMLQTDWAGGECLVLLCGTELHARVVSGGDTGRIGMRVIEG